jgi:gliding motility-associated-like protein
MFYAKITEENLCENSDSVLVKVQQVPEFYSNYTDTLVVVGQEFNINISSDQEGVNYQWTPTQGLSCSDCPNPIVNIEEATDYTVTIQDSASCHTVKQNIFIDIFYDFTLDVPNTFTPNEDGENDIVYVRGWGLKDLLEFRIYNRWGEEVFFSNDLKVGWDGTKDGKPQNMDSYAYYVRVLTFSDVEMTKKGTITLLR